jgi:hypothetical protein
MNTYDLSSINLIEGIDYFPFGPNCGINTSGTNNGFYGQKHTEETLKKMRKPKSLTANYFKPKSTTHKENMSKAKKGSTWTDTSRMSKISKCIHCGTEGIKVNITRYHNDNCKLREKVL